ncbi:MAG: LysR family transcriptional regulator [Burkholderiales bacterium]|nr:LysR family transcriptional regulator [Burkholderiales bacterium]
MNLTQRQLKAVVEIARLKSFTRAAEHLHISQQGLSLMVREVETQLDCRLFDRTTRAVALTPAGRQFLAVAEQTVRSLETAAAELGHMSAKARLSLSAAASPLIAATLLPEACAKFRALHPQVTVKIADVERERIQGMVETGEVDFGLGAFLKPSAGLERSLLFRCNLVCFCAASRSRKIPQMRQIADIPWKSIGDRPLLGLPADNPVQQLVDVHLAKIGRHNEERLTFRNFQTLLAMVEAGFGCAILPSFAVSAARRMNVEMGLIRDPVVSVDFFRVNQKGCARHPMESAFGEVLLATMKARCAIT